MALRIGVMTWLAACGLVAFQPQVSAAQQPNVEFTVSGNSTIRGWTCTTSGIAVVTPGTDSAPQAPGFPKGVQTVTLTVPVKAFKCPEEQMLEHLHQAMKADKFSEIVFRLEKYQMAGQQARATGTLTITDVTKPITVPIALRESAQGVEIEGNTPLDMTEFGIEPPVVFGGLLKVQPQIRIQFRGVVKSTAPSAAMDAAASAERNGRVQ